MQNTKSTVHVQKIAEDKTPEWLMTETMRMHAFVCIDHMQETWYSKQWHSGNNESSNCCYFMHTKYR